jgi:hypothetical protein
MRLRTAVLLAALALAPSPGPAAEETPAPTSTLYVATLIQAAPGRLLELLELEKAFRAGAAERGDESPWLLRHSQGDKWDLMRLQPIGSFAEYFGEKRAAQRDRWRQKSSADLERARAAIAWQEDVFVRGPALAEARERLSRAGFLHVEMFVALSGRRADLLREREMENAYQKALDRPTNLIFMRESGAAWDLFTIGGYRDLKHYAESADIPEAAQEAAARGAGFDGAKAIGPYLRTLIREHHDTLATAVP